ncbi:hypothetical protein E9Q_06633 [Moraxella catarrhalis BC1]|nr:hypothetical protein EJK50_0661 [Moraxella catarrhalis]EGE17665.1 hypothetical protein E9Q_06633 [Moraxella catarrhalis BC1]
MLINKLLTNKLWINSIMPINITHISIGNVDWLIAVLKEPF